MSTPPETDPSTASGTTVDSWIQHPTGAFIRHEMFASLRRWMGLTDDTIPDEFPIDFTIAAMDSAGVDVALTSAWYGPQGALLSNEAVAKQVKAYPDRLVGVASVDLRKPMEARDELKRCVEEYGFKALRILPWLWQLPPNHRWYYPLFVQCVELDIPFCLQVGHAGPLMPSEPGRPIPYLDEVACDFPELRIVGGHIGYPWTQDMIAMATKYRNVYIDTSAYKPSRYPAELVHFMKTNGSKKVLFGSNFPMLMPQACTSQVDSLELDGGTRSRFMGQNAIDVFRL